MSDAVCLVTSDESNKTWGRNTGCRQEEFEDVKRNFKKKGCTWGPSSIQMKERTDCKERYVCGPGGVPACAVTNSSAF